MTATAHDLGLAYRRPPKPYTLTYEIRPRYLYVRLRSSEISYEIAREYWNDIVVMLSRYPKKRILVDKDIAPEMSVADAYRMASAVAEEFRGVKIALCDRHADQRTLEFGNLVATNRGSCARSFGTIKDAESWLAADSH